MSLRSNRVTPRPRVDKAKKGKLAAKSTGHTSVPNHESIGVPRPEVKKFADPYHWLSYNPPIANVSPDFLFILSALTICMPRQTTVPWEHA